MALSETAIRKAKPEEGKKETTLSDGDGLLLVVRDTGAKKWVLRYWLDGKEKRAGLGKYPIVSLADARELKNQFKRELALGGNPQERKKAEKEAAAKEAEIKSTTFAKMADEWYKQQEKIRSESHCKGIRHKLKNILPKLGSRPISEIKTQEVLSLLLDIESRTPESAYKAKLIIGQVLRYAIARGDAEYDVTSNLKGAMSPRKQKHYAAITTPKDIADLLVRMESYRGSVVVRSALWFSLYTFQRPGEIRGATWNEVDFESTLWRIPAERMKNRRPHVVPLSRQVLEILEQLHNLTGDSPFVFPAVSSKRNPMSENTVRVALRSMGYTNEQMTAHGFRTTASTNLNEQGWNSDLIEMSLAHVEGNSVRAAYNRAERLAERRDMMQAWADWLDGLKK
ncbi:tyrosine-type recombinase/integrase [Synergistaceae bacterium OttesenSCG-928-I11]|nr:tyrosine-type recombinase/integrase [Synergistaceae bacterium OttesenSCG-928-I11]